MGAGGKVYRPDDQSDRYLTDKEKEHYAPPTPVSTKPDATLTRAKNLLREFCQEEYDSEPDFSDLSKIGIAYTNATDEEIPIQLMWIWWDTGWNGIWARC